MPPRLTLPLVVALMLVAPIAAAQSTLGEILDLGAQKISGEEFKQGVVQIPLAGLTPAGGTIDVMYIGNGTIVGSGTASRASVFQVPVSGQWVVDDQQRICTTMEFSSGGAGGGVQLGARMSLPTRCQFWFKLGESYYLADSDSDRHARVVRRTVASAPVPRAVTAATLPRAMKGNVYRTAFGFPPPARVYSLSLSIATVTPDGTLEGVVTLLGDVCAAREVPIIDGVLQSGEVRFRAPMGAACELSFVLSTGREHVLEGSAENTKARGTGATPMKVWLDANP